MATAKSARQQLSKDIADFFESTVTSAGCSADDFVDTALIDEGGNNQDEFLTDRATVWVEGGQTDDCCSAGPTSDEERRIDRDTSDLSTGSIDCFRAFSAALGPGIVYEVHRLFTAAEKDRAITQALTLVVPIVWAHVTSTITMVEDQYDYDISCDGYYRNIPHQVHKVSPSDSEITVPLHNWEPRSGTDIHLHFRPRADETLRLFGIGIPTLSGLDTGELLIVSARASIYMLETALNSNRTDQYQLFKDLLDNARTMYAERVRMFMKPAPAKQLLSQANSRSLVDIDFGIP